METIKKCRMDIILIVLLTGFILMGDVALVGVQTGAAPAAAMDMKGSVKITMPDGTVVAVGENEPLPDIPSGSTVEILDGQRIIAPSEGFIHVIAGNSVASIAAGDSVTVGRIGKRASFEVKTGEISIITGNTTTTVRAGQAAQTSLDVKTGIAEVKSIKGALETVTAGVKALISEGGTAKIHVDTETEIVHVEATDGIVEVTSIDGAVTTVAEGESIDTPGAVIGEIQTFPGEKAAEVPGSLPEEPAEPERPEGSGFR